MLRRITSSTGEGEYNTMIATGGVENNMVDVAIIGAGPYGLSIAAHLRALGVDYRIFGNPMSTWLTQMPKGMRLKSEGFASSLSDPSSTFPLAAFCKESGLPYADLGLPVSLDTFTAYGLEFQKRFVPNLENKQVLSVRRSGDNFQIRLESGETVIAHRVIMAVGISHFGYVPPVLSELPEEFVTHSSRHHSLEHFRGKEVAVVGAGASAVDIAALLHQAGAAVQLIARKPAIRFHDPPTGKPRSLVQRLKHPQTGIGFGWRMVFYVNTPHLFHLLPEQVRLGVVRKTLGPAPGWFVKNDVVGHVPFHLATEVQSAKIENGRLALELTSSQGTKNLVVDHVIAATGYRVNVNRLQFLDPDLMTAIKAVESTPVLSMNFESSVPGLFFVGTSAANSFGPLMRFAYGAEYVAGRLCRHIFKSLPVRRADQAYSPALAVPKIETAQPLKGAKNG
jgi:thioredoxin reductase